MSIAKLPDNEELTGFRESLLKITETRWDEAEESMETRLCSQIDPAAGETMPGVQRSGEPRDRRPPPASSLILDDDVPSQEESFLPKTPQSLNELGVRKSDVEAIILKFLLNSGAHVGFEIAKHIHIPVSLIRELLRELKDEKLLVFKASAAAGDFLYELSEAGVDRARRYWEHCTYFGSVPVSMRDYVASVHAQSVRKQKPKISQLQAALNELTIPHRMIVRLARAVNSGLGLFLYGVSGNGKTTIASRLTRAFGESVWVPRAISVGGAIMRLYDPSNHVLQPLDGKDDNRSSVIDQRWIRIRRPTIVVGGELTLDSFEARTSQATGITEAPIQLKSNCGTLVIDDFGRQRVSPTDILNRWIVPLAQRFDILRLANGRTFEFPVDQLIVFSTNLEPKDLVDEAFLRRIPYKIEVGNPSDDEFRTLLRKHAEEAGVKYQDAAVDYLLQKYYEKCGREMRYCHPVDILHQVCTYCEVLGVPPEITEHAIDAAAENYFSLL